MSNYKSSISNLRTIDADEINVEKIIASEIIVDELTVNNFTPGANTLNPNTIKPGVLVEDDITKLGAIESDIVDLSRVQSITGVKTFTASSTKFTTNQANNPNVVVLNNINNAGLDQVGLSFVNQSPGGITNTRTIAKDQVGGDICMYGPGNIPEVAFNDKVNLIKSTGEYRIEGVKVIDKISLGDSVVSSKLTSFGTINNINVGDSDVNTHHINIQDDDIASMKVHGANKSLLELASDTDESKLSIGPFDIQHSVVNNTDLLVKSGVNTILAINNNGVLGVGINPSITSSNLALVVDSSTGTRGMKLPIFTTVQRDALSSVQEGTMIYNETTKHIELFNNTIWESQLNHSNDTTTHGVSSDIVGESDIQIMSNKTLTNPVIGTILSESNELKIKSLNNVSEYAKFNSGGIDAIGYKLNGGVANFATKNNLSAIAAPTTGDNSVLGYVVGSRWLDTIQNKYYICENATNPANWVEIVDKNSAQSISNKTIDFGSNTLTNVCSTNTVQNITGNKTFKNQTNMESKLNVQYVSPEITIHNATNGVKYDISVDTSLKISNSTALNVLDDIVKIDNAGMDVKGDIKVNGATIVLKNNFDVVPPTANNDSSQGYALGSLWTNIANRTMYHCVDPVIASARWLSSNEDRITFQQFTSNSSSFIQIVSFIAGTKYHNTYDVIINPAGLTVRLQIYNLSTAAIVATLDVPPGLPLIVSLNGTGWFNSPLETLILRAQKISGSGSYDIFALTLR